MFEYRLQLAQRWQFHPRDIDELTVVEFDHFAMQSDAMTRDEAAQRRKADMQAARRR